MCALSRKPQKQRFVSTLTKNSAAQKTVTPFHSKSWLFYANSNDHDKNFNQTICAIGSKLPFVPLCEGKVINPKVRDLYTRSKDSLLRLRWTSPNRRSGLRPWRFPKGGKPSWQVFWNRSQIQQFPDFCCICMTHFIAMNKNQNQSCIQLGSACLMLRKRTTYYHKWVVFDGDVPPGKRLTKITKNTFNQISKLRVPVKWDIFQTGRGTSIMFGTIIFLNTSVVKMALPQPSPVESPALLNKEIRIFSIKAKQKSLCYQLWSLLRYILDKSKIDSWLFSTVRPKV